MGDNRSAGQDAQVLKWGGLSGILGSTLFIIAMAFVMVFIGTEDPEALNEWAERFPDIHMARVVENLLYLAGLLFQIPLFLAVYQALRKENLAPALFGCVIGIVGLIPMIASATPHVAHAPVAEIYHSGAVSMATKDAIDVMWQATWGVFNAPLYVGFFVVPIGIIFLGISMFGSTVFGGVFRLFTVVLGCAGAAAAVMQMIDPASPIGVVSYLTFIVFGYAAGVKVRRLSK